MKANRRASLSIISAGAAAVALSTIREQQQALAPRKLRGRVVLITGGSRGLGLAIARELAALGARLALTSRNLEELEAAKADLVAAGTKPEDVMVLAADVSHAEEIQEVVGATVAYFGRIDVVINNAGVILVGPIESQKLDSFQQAMNINFFGALHTTLAVLPQMLKRGSGGIINIASIGGKVAFPHLLPYVASKFALTGWSQGLHAELARKGVHVMTVAPGVMRTGSHVQARYSGDQRAEYRWFASAASFPGTATDASAAARKIIKGFAVGKAEISIGFQAIAAARLCNLAPEWTATALKLANQFLPKNGTAEANFMEADQSVVGKEFRGSLPRMLEWLGSKSIREYNQE